MKQSLAKENVVNDATLIWVFAAQGLSIAPLLLSLPPWILLLWLAALTWRWQIQRRRWPFPTLIVKLGLGMLIVAAILGSFSRLSGFEPMIGFLVCAFALKLIELRSNKDVLTVLFIGFIAVAAQFLFAQTIVSALFALVACSVLVTAWQAAFTTRSKKLWHHFRLGGVLVLHSLPFMILMFVVMPRIEPLWSVPVPSGAGTTGFSDELTLGEIGRLAKSSAPAFRASFSGPKPPAQELYWRGLVLEHFDGHSWRPPVLGPLPSTVPALIALPSTRYSVILEPHQQPWLFALGVPVMAQSEKLDIELHAGNLLRAERPVTNKVQYTVDSIVELPAISEPLGPERLRALTQLPVNSNPRSAALAQSWLEQQLTPRQIVDAALGIYTADFRYTLQPPVLAQPAIDEFLFESRAGFCEHFASSFVFLMRAASIPSRIVVGYQGGEFNPVEDYYLIRQSDAHAWAELWLEDEGWIRIDPTAAVAPSRIEQGIEEALPVDDRDLVQGVWQQSEWLYRVHYRLDAMGYSWNRWVLNYDNQTKVGLLTRLLGGIDPWRLALAFVCISGLSFLMVWVWPQLQFPRSVRGPEQKQLLKVLAKLQRKGFRRTQHETVQQFFERVGKELPEDEAVLQDIADEYYGLVYGGNPAAASALKRSVSLYLRR